MDRWPCVERLCENERQGRKTPWQLSTNKITNTRKNFLSQPFEYLEMIDAGWELKQFDSLTWLILIPYFITNLCQAHASRSKHYTFVRLHHHHHQLRQDNQHLSRIWLSGSSRFFGYARWTSYTLFFLTDRLWYWYHCRLSTDRCWTLSVHPHKPLQLQC